MDTDLNSVQVKSAVSASITIKRQITQKFGWMFILKEFKFDSSPKFV